LPGETCRAGEGIKPLLLSKLLNFKAICSGGRKFDKRVSARTAPTRGAARRRGKSRPFKPLGSAKSAARSVFLLRKQGINSNKTKGLMPIWQVGPTVA
jgi:hypothetical protein